MVLENNGEISHIGFKAPAFIQSNVTAWFTIVEANFTLSKITTEETKFLHVISSLPPEVITSIPPVVLQEKSFTSLKNTIIENYEKSKPELFEKLTSQCVMTGRPSAYLTDLQQTAQKVGGVNDDLIRFKFIQALPSHMISAIATQKNTSLTDLGKLADELIVYKGCHPGQVHNVPADNYETQYRQQGQTHNVPTTNYENQYRQQGHIYNIPTNNYENRPRSHGHYSYGGQIERIPIGLKPFHDNQRPVVCRAHLYYGQRAKNCKPWCRWPNKGNINILPNSRPGSPVRQSGN